MKCSSYNFQFLYPVKDIVISGARKPLHRGIINKDKDNLTQKNVATCLRYSLRVCLFYHFFSFVYFFEESICGFAECLEDHIYPLESEKIL
jgi:hypothetical protein